MTQEEKAKAYDEAKYIMKEYLESGNAGVIAENTIKKAFPELAESEDERIRKVIADIVKAQPSDSLFNGTKEKCLAWLEEQGQHKKFRDSIQVGDKVTRNEDGVLVNLSQLNRVAKKDEKQGEQKPDDKVEPKFKVKYAGSEYNVLYVKDIAGATFYGIEDEPNHIDYVQAENCEIVSEQKPTDKIEPKFKVGNKIKLAKEPKYPAREIIAIQNDAYYFDEAIYLPFSRQDEWELVEQKPAETEKGTKGNNGEITNSDWSEEDMNRIDHIISFMEDKDRVKDIERLFPIEEDVRWLKSLKDRVQPQVKQEWSKEDEAFYQRLEQIVFKVDIEAFQGDRDLHSWLKSLRPQSHWKPSDEQMKALSDISVTGCISYAGQGQELINLYQDLYTIWKEKEVLK